MIDFVFKYVKFLFELGVECKLIEINVCLFGYWVIVLICYIYGVDYFVVYMLVVVGDKNRLWLIIRFYSYVFGDNINDLKRGV